jgi:uncharacterized protein GlcG (DUF336 family)
MKTTLNFPDELIAQAKIEAVRRNTTLTALIVDALEHRMAKTKVPGTLPVSTSSGGLSAGHTWENIRHAGGDELYR